MKVKVSKVKFEKSKNGYYDLCINENVAMENNGAMIEPVWDVSENALKEFKKIGLSKENKIYVKEIKNSRKEEIVDIPHIECKSFITFQDDYFVFVDANYF